MAARRLSVVAFPLVYVLAAAMAVFAGAQEPARQSAQELLQRMRQASSWERSVSMSETIDKVSAGTGQGNWGHIRTRLVYRRDADRVEWLGDQELLDPAGTPTPKAKFRDVRIFGD